MNQPRSRRAIGSAHDASARKADGETLARMWLASDPVPPEIRRSAKAAFTRHGPSEAPGPMVLDLRDGGDLDGGAGAGADVLRFGGEPTNDDTVDIRVEIEPNGDRWTVRCVVHARRIEPTAVMAQSPDVDRPMHASPDGSYRIDGLEPGPLRIAVHVAAVPVRSVVTSWFTL